MKSLDRNSLEEQTKLVARYVAGDLSRSERAEFEAWLVASPELAAEVDMERRLRRGMASAARRGWLKRQTPERLPAERRWQMALAASVVLGLGLTVGLSLPRVESAGDATLASRGGTHGTPMVVRLGRVRGIGDSPDFRFDLTHAPSQLVIEPAVVVLTCDNGAVELECADGFEPRNPQYPEYELDLVKRRGSTLAWRSARQQPTMGTELSFTLRDPSRLTAGDYEVVVRGVSADREEVVGRFWMQVSAN